MIRQRKAKVIALVLSALTLTACYDDGVQPTASVPVLATIFPASAPVGAPELVVTVRGSSFAPSTVIQWNGITLPTTVISNRELRVRVSAAQLANPGIANVVAVNGAVGGASNALKFDVVSNGVSRPTRLELNMYDVALDVGELVLLSAVARDDAGNVYRDVDVLWSSSDTRIAMITPHGLVLAIAPGQVTIAARVLDISSAATITVSPASGRPVRP